MTDAEESDANKVIFLGESSVGKTNLIKVAVGQKFDPDSITTWAPTNVTKEYVYNNKKYLFNLWDTIGQELYRSLSKIFFKDSDIVVLVYDITSRKSFEELEYWHETVQKELSGNYVLALVGNKSDLFTQEQVTEEEGRNYAEKIGAKFKLTSAKNEAANFVRFLEETFEDYLKKNSGSNSIRLRGLTIDKLQFEQKPKKKSFC